MAQGLPAVKTYLQSEEQLLKQHFLSLKKSQPQSSVINQLLSRALTATEEKKVLQWYRSEKEFQKKYDLFQNKKLKYMADKVLANGACFKQEISKISMSSADRIGISEKWSALTKQQLVYSQKRPLFGTSKDYLRVLAYNDLYRAQEAFTKALEDALDVQSLEIESGVMQLTETALTLPQLAKIMYALNFERQSRQGETPILNAIGEGVRVLGTMNQVSVKLQGINHLPAPVYDGKTVNIIAFEHANSYLDTIVQAHIPEHKREGLGFFGAAKYVFPPSWVTSLDKSDHYIVVNQGKEVPRTLEIIRARKLHGFFAAAEGLTPAGLMETRPVSPLFIKTYWELKSQGLNINLVPMSFPDNFRVYNAWKGNGPAVSTGVFKPQLSSHAADVLYTITKEKESIGIWLRSAWHETLKTNDQLLLSSPNLNVLEDSVQNRLWGKIRKNFNSRCL